MKKIILCHLAAFLIGGVVATTVVALHACDTVRDRAGSGTGAFVDCEAPNLKTAVAELVPVFRLAVLKLITGDGKVDTTALRAACAALVGDLPRCAMASAIAILAAPAPNTGATVIAVPLAVPDPGDLRMAFEAVRIDWGGASYRTASGTL